MQRLLRHADWDTREVRDDMRDYVIENLGDPQGVLIADGTGFLKKGTRSAGVQRQYSGTAGRTENCQIGVFLAYASRHGHALIDRELYLPQSWMSDRDRCRAAGIPDDIEFAPKARLPQAMLERVIEAGVPFAWFTADEVYGQTKYLRRWLEERDVAYVMAIRRTDTFPVSGSEQRAGALTAMLSGRSWQRLSAGAGAHGPREYHWARVSIEAGAKAGRGHWLLARRSLHDPDEIAYYACYGPAPSRLIDLAWGRRQPLACGGMLPAGQERSRARPLPGPLLAGLVCPHHPLDAGPGLAVRHQNPGRKRGTGPSSPGMIGYTLELADY